ncbi:TlpA family protein disulfide reductase [Chitinophaga sp. Hz27]|uniref:TlpA family protein disulfide reductase n=1 Tax=Chitinophaga sp. Hz27 TaxID=3347169 RepID=UPI0035D6E31B
MKPSLLLCCMFFLATAAFAQKDPKSVIYKITNDYSYDDHINLLTVYFRADFHEQTKAHTVADLTLLRVKIRSIYGEDYVPEIFDTDSLDESPFYGFNFYYYTPMIGKRFTVEQDCSLSYLGENADSLRVKLAAGRKINQNLSEYLLRPDSGMWRFANILLSNKSTEQTKIEELPLTSIKGRFDDKYAFMLWDMLELQQAREDDSVRVRAFLNANNPIYGKRNTYRQKRVGLLQHMDSPEYYDELAAMPIDLLKGEPSHLFNKISDADQRLHIPADSIVKIIKVMNNRFRSSFLQESFCQSIIYGKEGKEPVEKERYAADTILLNKLLISNIPNIKSQLRALSLMNSAVSTTDTALITAYARELDNLTSNDMIYGRLPRYRTLIEKHMQQYGLNAAAAAYREGTIQRIRSFNDSIKMLGQDNNYKEVISINKALLADCWYRKYQATQGTDSATAFEYLLKTITDGPSTKEELNKCFYDLAMTQGKGEYLEEVTAVAENTGRKDVALGMLVKQQDMDHDKLDALQLFYEKNYPGKSFDEFVRKDLVNRWKVAPDFDLQGTGGKRYKLSDYKGKWLLLDFWGSWCSPCCADLPKLNALATQVEQNNNGAAVLAIACHEAAATSEKYLQTKGYTLASAFSGDATAIRFGVTGYPFKVLISPDGKMLPLVFGENYSSIMRKYMAAGTGKANNISPNLQTKPVRD